MIKTTEMLLDELKEYKSPKMKLSRMVSNKEIFPIVRGLYETDCKTSAHLLAASIYGPSYVSFEYALSYYNLIPERVFNVTSATFKKRKSKCYRTSFGTFFFQDVPSSAFAYGLRIIQEGTYYFRIAEPEKALCDQVYKMYPTANLKEMYQLLVDNLRIEEESLVSMNLESIKDYCELYCCTNVNRLYSLLKRMAQ